MSSDCWWGSAGHVWLFLGHEPVRAKYILKHIIQGIIERTPGGGGSSQQAQSMMSQRAYASLSLRDLHWLPVLQRVQFKSLCMVHRAAHGKGPIPLQNRFTWYGPSRNLCSAAAHLVCTSKIRRVRIGGRAFSHTALCLWNKLPLDLRFRIYNSVEKDWKSGCSPGIRSTSCFLYSHLTSAVLVIAAPGYPSGDGALYKCFLHYMCSLLKEHSIGETKLWLSIYRVMMACESHRPTFSNKSHATKHRTLLPYQKFSFQMLLLVLE